MGLFPMQSSHTTIHSSFLPQGRLNYIPYYDRPRNPKTLFSFIEFFIINKFISEQGGWHNHDYPELAE